MAIKLLKMTYLVSTDTTLEENLKNNIDFYIDSGNGLELWSKSESFDDYGRLLVTYNYNLELDSITDDSSYPPKTVIQPKEISLVIKTKNGFGFLNDTLVVMNTNAYPNVEYFKYTGSPFEKSATVTINQNSVSEMGINKNLLELIPYDLPSTEKLPYSKIYNMTVDDLDLLSRYAYIDREVIDSATGTVTTITENYGKYITGLYVFPYDLVSDENELTNVFLGDKDTEIQGLAVTEHIKIVNLGSIIIPKDISKGVGYKNVTIDLYLPYFNKINLDVDEVLGGKIDLTLHLNLITGKGTINIRNYDTDSIIHSESTQIGVKIPYELSDSINVNIGSEVLETDYSVPYVEMKVLRPENSASLFPVAKIDIDKDFNYIKDSDDLIFSTIATEREQKLIKDMVSRGVFVRK